MESKEVLEGRIATRDALDAVSAVNIMGPNQSLRDKVFESLGAASACWEHIDRAGEFDPERAIRVGEDLMRFIDSTVHAAHRADRLIVRLASFIVNDVPGEPSQSEDAVSCAIRVIQQLQAENAELRRGNSRWGR